MLSHSNRLDRLIFNLSNFCGAMQVNVPTITGSEKEHVENQSRPQAHAYVLPSQNGIDTEPPCILASSHANTYAPIGVQHVCSQLESTS
jgi:hypothetical protein